MSDIQCIVVTPEKTEVDMQASSVVVPMFDGELGILKNHSPLVGRLGYGVLRISNGGASENYFIEGGFVQVAANVVSVLTDRVTSMAKLSSSVAEQALRDALEMPSDKPELAIARKKACERANAMRRVTSA